MRVLNLLQSSLLNHRIRHLNKKGTSLLIKTDIINSPSGYKFYSRLDHILYEISKTIEKIDKGEISYKDYIRSELHRKIKKINRYNKRVIRLYKKIFSKYEDFQKKYQLIVKEISNIPNVNFITRHTTISKFDNTLTQDETEFNNTDFLNGVLRRAGCRERSVDTKDNLEISLCFKQAKIALKNRQWIEKITHKRRNVLAVLKKHTLKVTTFQKELYNVTTKIYNIGKETTFVNNIQILKLQALKIIQRIESLADKRNKIYKKARKINKKILLYLQRNPILTYNSGSYPSMSFDHTNQLQISAKEWNDFIDAEDNPYRFLHHEKLLLDFNRTISKYIRFSISTRIFMYFNRITVKYFHFSIIIKPIIKIYNIYRPIINVIKYAVYMILGFTILGIILRGLNALGLNL